MKILEIPIDSIRPSPYQPRLTFNINDLKEEIERDGLLSDLVVRKREGFYEIIDGERRWRVLKELGWKTVPVRVVDVDNRIAMRSVYKLNKVRQNYTVEEEARYFKKLADEGMTAYMIGQELNVDDDWVRANLNVFKFPEDIQKSVWSKRLSVSHIMEIEPIIASNIDEATKVTREILLRKLTRDETRKLISGRVGEIEQARIKAAEEALGVRTPISVKLETPEEIEKAAQTLRKLARKKREEAMTPKEKAAIEVEKKRKLEERRRKKEEERRRREEAERRRIEEEAKKRAKILEEEEKRRIEEEVKRKAREEALEDVEFLRKARARAEKVLPPPRPEIVEKTGTMKKPPYLTLEEPLPVQYHHQRVWNLKQLIGRDLSLKGKDFHFDFVTIGYSQKTFESFCDSLKAAGVTLVLDIRKNPRSLFKVEFNKTALEKEFPKIGIHYEHLPELGIPREVRDKAYEGKITPEELFKQYEAKILTAEVLERLEKLSEGHHTIAILCTEVDPTMCHRHKIAEALTRRGKMGYDL